MARIPEHAPHLLHIPLKRAGLVAGAITMGAAGVGLGAQMLFGADRGPQTVPQEPSRASDTIKPPEGGQDVGIVTNPPAEATAEAQKPAPEVKIVGNGAIVPEELSTTGAMREFEYQGQVYKLALYNLPDGTPITAPKDGYFVARKESEPFIGSGLSVFNPVDLTVPNIGLSGSLQVVSRLSRNVKAGEIVAYIQDTGEKMFGEYNFGVIITSQNSTGTGFFSPDAPYKEYLPDLPKGPRIIQTQPIQSSSGNVYLPKEK